MNPNEKKLFTVLNKKRQEVLFIDEGVYTKNRNFRLFMSSKLGKTNSLQISKTKSVAVNSNSSIEFDRNIFLSSLIMNVPEDQEAIHVQRKHADNKTNSLRECEKNLQQQSTFSEIDKLILDIIKPGTIRRVKYFENSNTQKPVLVYDVSGYNYCSKIGRCHKSNNVYFVANIFEQMAYQKCYGCPGFKGFPISFEKDYDHRPEFDEKDNPDLLLACSSF